MKGPGFYFYQFFFGKFSSKFNRYCQQKDIPTPYKLCYHDDPDHHIYEIFFPNTKFKIYNAIDRIKFEKIAFFSTLKEHKKKYKKVYGYAILHMEGKDLRVFCYRKDVFGHRAKVLYYFLDNTFILGEYIFMSYTKEKVSKIAKELAKLYHFNIDGNFESYYVEDSSNGRMMFNDTGFDINIKFLNLGKEEINNFLYSYYTREEEELIPEH